MKKYLFIYKSEIMSKLQYFIDSLFGIIGYFIHIFIFINLWEYIYSDPQELINGYTINNTIWYVILTEVIWSCVESKKMCRKISNDVRSGNIAYNINKPYSYIGYILSSSLGDITAKLLAYIPISLLIGLIFLKSFPNLNIISIILVILSLIIAIIINCLSVIALGLLSFYIEDSGPVYWMYSKILLIIGTVFPIEFFPKAFAKILMFSPIVAMNYGPAKLFVNFSYKTFLYVISVQIFYLIFHYFLCVLIYKKGVRKLNVNGG